MGETAGKSAYLWGIISTGVVFVKIVGNRREPLPLPSGNWDSFIELAWTFRKDKYFVPRGVYRFKTFKEANLWEEKMMLGEKPSADSRHGMT